MPFLRNVVNSLGGALSNKAARAISNSNDVKEPSKSPIYLPGARVLKEYNITGNNNLFWITLNPKIIGTPVIKRDDIRVENKKLFVPDSTKLETFKILYNDEMYSQSHTHNWEKSSVQETINEGAKILNGQLGNMVSRGMKESYNSLFGGTNPDGKKPTAADVATSLVTNIGQRDQYFAANVLDFYANSGMVPVEVKFNLVAFDNPITDIILPIKRLVSLTYPQLVNVVTQKKIAGMVGNALKKQSSPENAHTPEALENSRQDLVQISTESREAAKRAQSTALNASASKIVAHYGNPPVLWDVGLSNDLQFMKNAYCKSINVQYMGPWMGKPDQTSAFAGLFGNIKDTVGAGLFGAILNPSSVNNALNQGDPHGHGGYPSYATVSMVFEPALTQTADDILALGAEADEKGVIKTTTVGGKTSHENRINEGLNKGLKKGRNSVNKFLKNRFGNDLII